MPGLVPGIHVLLAARNKDVDGRDRPGHDDVSARDIPPTVMLPIPPTVMPGLVPGIHVLLASGNKDVDGHDKPGHDDVKKRE